MNPIIEKIINSETLEEHDLFSSKGKIYTFLNPVSYLSAREYPELFASMDGIFADGSLFSLAIKMQTGISVTRRSFDMTSLASVLFRYAMDNGRALYLIGGDESDIELSVAVIQKYFPKLRIAGHRNGYFSDTGEDYRQTIAEIVKIQPDYLIAGMGVLRQERFIQDARKAGFKGIGFTCGGFFSQLAKCGIKYYPGWVDRLNLRFAYRFINEPHTRSRYLSALLKFPIAFIRDAH